MVGLSWAKAAVVLVIQADKCVTDLWMFLILLVRCELGLELIRVLIFDAQCVLLVAAWPTQCTLSS